MPYTWLAFSLFCKFQYFFFLLVSYNKKYIIVFNPIYLGFCMCLSHSYTSTFPNSRKVFSDFVENVSFGFHLDWFSFYVRFFCSIWALHALFLDFQTQYVLWLSNPVPVTCLQVLLLLLLSLSAWTLSHWISIWITEFFILAWNYLYFLLIWYYFIS